jgi:hypothetical protein
MEAIKTAPGTFLLVLVIVVVGIVLGLSPLHIVEIVLVALLWALLLFLGTAAWRWGSRGGAAAQKAIRSGGFAFLREGEVKPVVRSRRTRLLRSGGFSLLRDSDRGISSWTR